MTERLIKHSSSVQRLNEGPRGEVCGRSNQRERGIPLLEKILKVNVPDTPVPPKIGLKRQNFRSHIRDHLATSSKKIMHLSRKIKKFFFWKILNPLKITDFAVTTLPGQTSHVLGVVAKTGAISGISLEKVLPEKGWPILDTSLGPRPIVENFWQVYQQIPKPHSSDSWRQSAISYVNETQSYCKRQSWPHDFWQKKSKSRFDYYTSTNEVCRCNNNSETRGITWLKVMFLYRRFSRFYENWSEVLG